MTSECSIKLLEVIALTSDAPEKGLLCGQVGTVVEMLGQNMFEVDDNQGQRYAQGAFGGAELKVLHFHPAH